MSTQKTLCHFIGFTGSSLLTAVLLSGCGTSKTEPSSSSLASSSVVTTSSSTSGQSSSVVLPTGPGVQTRPPNATGQTPMFKEQTRAPAMTSEEPYQVEEVATGLQTPWGIQFMPDGRALLTEREGNLRIIDASGVFSDPIAGVPAVKVGFQAGLLDVTIAPDFASSRMVYLSYSENRPNNKNCTTVGRGRLSNDERTLENFQVIFRQNLEWASDLHFGSRLVWSSDNLLYITMGERSLPETRYYAQDLDVTLGKVLRVNGDGSAAAGNPFFGGTEQAKIWSYGHRNIQAAAIHPETGKLWTIEHGPKGGDELNQPEAGKNYGWPEITYGEDYSGLPIGDGVTQRVGMEQPVYYWDPVIAPSGMIFYSGNMFPSWRNNIFVGSLTPGGLVRLMLYQDKVVGEEVIYNGRTRDVEQAPDGSLWILQERPGRINRIFR